MAYRNLAFVVMCLIAAVAPPAPAATITTFTGADAGEGLDLDGTFPYAIDLGNFGGQVIRDATFTNWITTPGFTTTNAASYGGTVPDFPGTDSGDDNDLEAAMTTGVFRGSPAGFLLTFSALAPGRPYQVQLLFMETFGTTRALRVDFGNNGSFEVTGLNPLANQGGDAVGPGTVVTETLIASPGGQITILIDATTSLPFLNDVTLESVPEPASLALLGLGVLAIAARRRDR